MFRKEEIKCSKSLLILTELLYYFSAKKSKKISENKIVFSEKEKFMIFIKDLIKFINFY